jgi:hypothetical protein
MATHEPTLLQTLTYRRPSSLERVGLEVLQCTGSAGWCFHSWRDDWPSPCSFVTSQHTAVGLSLGLLGERPRIWAPVSGHAERPELRGAGE